MPIDTLAHGLDGTSQSIKAAGQLPALTDTAMVVTIRPDDPSFNDTTITGAVGQTALNSNILLPTTGNGWLDMVNDRSILVQIVTSAGISAGVVMFEGNNDGSNNVSAVQMYDVNTISTKIPVTSLTLAASTNRFFFANIPFRYFRIRISTAVAGGTVQAFSNQMGSIYPLQDNLVRLGDGTNNVTVKAASVAPAVTDPALVSSISPNLPAPTMYSVLSAASNNAANIKNSAGRVYSMTLYNASTSIRYVRLYNTNTAPTMGTTTPYIVVAVQPSTSKELAFHLFGMLFSTGISIAITGGATDLDNTAVSAGDVRVLIAYV